MIPTLRHVVGALMLKCITAAAGIGAVMAPHVGHGQSPSLEAQVKATYLYNFIQFVEWPQTAWTKGEDFPLCVLGADRLSAALTAFDGEQVDGRVLRARRLTHVDEAAANRCKVVFLPRGAGDSAELLARLPNQGVLTVGEAADFVDAGGMIGLYQVRGRVHFSINDRAARRAGLVVSSRLLQLARERS